MKIKNVCTRRALPGNPALNVKERQLEVSRAQPFWRCQTRTHDPWESQQWSLGVHRGSKRFQELTFHFLSTICRSPAQPGQGHLTSQSTSEDTKRDLRNYSVKHLLVSLNMRKHDSNLNCGWKAIRTPLSRWPRKTIHGEPRSPRRKPLVSHEELGLKDGQDEGTWQYWVHFQAKELWLEQKKINLWDFSLQIYLIQYNEISMAIGSYGIVGTKGDVPVI
jgi:hypothetical protein